MSDFDDLDRAVMDAFGAETAIIEPRRREQYAAGTADLDRPGASVRGVFSAAPATQGVEGASGEPRPGVTSVASEAAEFWISAAERAALDAAIRSGDRLRLVERGGEPTFIVSYVQNTDAGDANLILTRG